MHTQVTDIYWLSRLKTLLCSYKILVHYAMEFRHFIGEVGISNMFLSTLIMAAKSLLLNVASVQSASQEHWSTVQVVNWLQVCTNHI